jgi:hypothetical protein
MLITIVGCFVFPTFVGAVAFGGTWSHVGSAGLAVAVCFTLCALVTHWNGKS